MGPDGVVTLGAVWALVGLLIVGVTLMGHRFGRRTVRHSMARAGGSVATIIAGILAAAVTLNAHYGWYTSWADITASVTGEKIQGKPHQYGAQPTATLSPERKRAADAENAAADARFAATRATFERGLPKTTSAAGEWVHLTVPGIPMTGKNVGRVMVWLPGSYFKHPERTYPVIEAFHGIPGGTLDYERVFHLDGALRDAEAKHQVRDAIIVVPQEMPGGVDTECVNGGGLSMETWLTKTVPDFVVQHLRAQASHESWLALGVSAGGWCASMAALLHPDRYAGLVSLGGYFSPDFSNWKPFPKGVPARYDLVRRVAEHPSDQALWVLVSGADKLSGPTTDRFIKAVRPPYSLTTVDYPGAGHRTDVWISALPDVFSWMAKAMPEFSARAGSSSAAAPTSSVRSGAPGESGRSVVPLPQRSSATSTAPGAPAPLSTRRTRG